MMLCPNCNKVLEDGSRFCDNCGQQIFTRVFCQCCGVETSTEYDYCPNCGAVLEKGAVVQPQTGKKKAVRSKKTFKLPKKLIAIGSACVAVVLIAALVLSLLLRGGNKENYAVYLKDKEVYYMSMAKAEPWQITTQLIENGDVEQSELAESAYIFENYIQMSSDGKLLFYFDKVDEDSEGMTLFCRYVNKPKKEPVKIDSDITHYSISKSGKCVTYMKGEDRILYQHDLTDREKIASDVSGYGVSADGKKLGWLNRDGDLYLKYAGKEKEKMESGINWVEFANEKLDTVYYVKDDSLYKLVEGKEREKIASDVSDVIKVYESGEIYYAKSDSAESSLLDYVEDDLKDSDAFMEKPKYPEYPSYWDYDSYDEYDAAMEQYDADYEAYEQARDAYYEKLERDELREELAEETLNRSVETLYYYDGKAEKELGTAYVYGSAGDDYIAAVESPTLIFSACEQTDIKKVKLSEIESVYDVEEAVEKAMELFSEKCIAVKDNITEIEQNEAVDFAVSPDGKTVYFMDDVSEEYYGDLYRIEISGNKPKKAELYDSDVYRWMKYFWDNDTYIYCKDAKDDNKVELYINQKKIDYDVRPYYVLYQKEADMVVYLTDWNAEKEYGTLKMFKNGKAVKIADDVHTYEVTPNGEILYLSDYNCNYYSGELFLYKNKKAKKIDDDVTAIIKVDDGQNENSVYYGW